MVWLISWWPLLAEQGLGTSSLFTVDTRWGFSDGASVSGLFRIDTRLSGSASAGASGLFTVDTLGAGVGSATFAGYVTDGAGPNLVSATVSALQNSVVRRQASTDASGYYELNSLPAGTYQLRAEKPGHLTGLRHGVSLVSNQTRIEHFALVGRPAAPTVTTVSRIAEQLNLVPVSSPQLQVFTDGNFVTGGAIDPAKMTVVMTHGWLSQPDIWAKSMASNMVAGGVENANLVAWDWRTAAGHSDLGLSFSATRRQGERLGQALEETLGPGYGLPLHFIGHSLGTLVNAEAANYLHEETGGAFPPSRTHVTLLDDAVAANVAGPLITMSYTVPGLGHPWSFGPSAAILAQVTSVGFVFPVPRERAWLDNYVSLVGFPHDEAVNVLLVNGAEHISPWIDVIELHGYAPRWYGKTALSPTASLLGHRYSNERMNSGLFPQTVPYSAGAVFSQVDGGAELDLTRLYSEDDVDAALTDVRTAFVQLGLQKTVDAAIGVVQRIGDVIVDVAEAFVPHTPTGTPFFSGSAGSASIYHTESALLQTPAWSLRVNLRTVPPPSLTPSNLHPIGNRPQPQGDEGAELPCVWIPVAVPANAAVFCFDFSFAGEPGEDLLSASIGGINVFASEARFMPTNTTLNSGPIDVSRWASQTVEFFFGVLGATSTNANMTLSGMRFYQVEAPTLNAELLGNGLSVSWPATFADYVLESKPGFAGSNQWLTVTNVPALRGLRNVVTNSVSDWERFYRLKRE